MDTDKHSRFYVPLSVSSAVSLLYLLGSAYESSFPVVPVPLAMTAEKAVLGRTRSARDDAERTSAAAIELMAEAARTPSRDRKTGTDLEHATHADHSLTTVMDSFRTLVRILAVRGPESWDCRQALKGTEEAFSGMDSKGEERGAGSQSGVYGLDGDDDDSVGSMDDGDSDGEFENM